MKTQRFGVEIELTGISRKDAAKVIANYFGTQSAYEGTVYGIYTILDNRSRKWTAMNDSSIDARDKDGNRLSGEYKCEIVTPILEWNDIETLQAIVRLLRKNGAIANASCGIHVHVDATSHTAKTLRNLVNIMTAKEDILFKALAVTQSRADRWCRKTDEEFVSQLNHRKPTTESGIERLWYNGRSRSSFHYDDTRYHALNLHSLWQGKGIEFRCFNGTTHAGKIKTYIQLCLAISHQALTQKAASARKTASTNEKYTMRTWLLRMGMIGDEFKTARQFLLESLDGDIAFRNGRPNRVAG